MKIKKKRKSKRERGQTTYGHGARKKWKGSGHKGGKGMAGSGKRADQKKTLVHKLYGGKYFGKQGITSKGTARKRELKINVREIERNYDSLMRKFGKNGILDLSKYKILGDGEITRTINLKVGQISAGALDKIQKAGGKVEVLKKKSEESESESEEHKEHKKHEEANIENVQ